MRSSPSGFPGGLERYQGLIDDWDAFVEALGRPEPATLRVNRLRIDREGLAERLASQGFETEPVVGQPDLLRVRAGPRSVSETLEHWGGLAYIQQAATALAAPLLGARPGEHVLDLCAAPGGKTTHIAELMAGRGTIVAVEVNESRIRALLGNIYRLGHTNILVVSADGRSLPEAARFDRVLVDVPCSAEGTVRKKGGRLPRRSRGFVRQVTRAQEKLLRKAIELTRPGGTVLYVTCTFGTEENEAVVSRVLQDAPVEVEPLDPGVPHARGVTSWEGERFDRRLDGAVRIYPHHLDSGGLFLCRLTRTGPSDPTASPVGWGPVPGRFPSDADEPAEPAGAQVSAALGVLADTFGVDAADFAEWHWMRRGANLWLHACDVWPVEAWPRGGHWRVVALGMRAVDLSGRGPPRPTNDLLRWLGPRITRRRVELSAARWCDLLDGRDVLGLELPDGYVALVLDGQVVGWGFLRGGRLHSHVPRGRARWLRSVAAAAQGP